MPARRSIGWAWDRLGTDNAFGAILTRDGQVADWDPAEFLATGREDAARFVADLARIVPHAGRGRALDFGCGVGRIARALSEHFDHVTGVDAAPSMIERARTLNADRPRCTFTLNRAPHLRTFATGSFDVVYSRLVLQHIQPRIVRKYIPELIRVVAPGGALMFQLPEVQTVDSRKAFEDAPVIGGAWKRRLPRGVVVSWRRLKYLFIRKRSGPMIEMFGMTRAEVERLIAGAGGRLAVAAPDRSHGEQGRGFEYWVTRA
jgi:ubiquinone/menaquinone biosynthesis C-methylase UbiE